MRSRTALVARTTPCAGSSVISAMCTGGGGVWWWVLRVWGQSVGSVDPSTTTHLYTNKAHKKHAPAVARPSSCRRKDSVPLSFSISAARAACAAGPAMRSFSRALLQVAGRVCGDEPGAC
jgi:hypothetical protein